MFPEPLFGGSWFNHCSIRSKTAPQDGRSSGSLHRIVQIADDILFINFCIPDVFSKTFPVYRQSLEMKGFLQLLEESPQSSCVVKVLHQVFPGRSQIEKQRDPCGNSIKTFQVERNFRTSCQGCEVDDRIRRTANGHVHHDRVFIGLHG